jgi:DNA replication protein
MDRSTDDLVKILAAGGGLVLDAGRKSIDDLMKIARAGAEGECLVTMRNVGEKTTEELIKIVTVGDGSVVFEV